MNAIQLEVMRHLFSSIAEEMGVSLMRSAFSPNIKERRDYSCAIFDASGEMVAQAAHIPVHLGSTPRSVEAVLEAFPQGVPEGEHVLVNDPYQGGTHLPDLTLVTGVYDSAGVLRFYVANRAHHADVGGISPGSLPISSHIDDEGFRTGPALLDDALSQKLFDESRTPDERRGDLFAQVAANQRGSKRLQEQLAKYGEGLLQAARDLQDYSEARMRHVIKALPDGVWRGEDVLEDDGHGATDLKICCEVSISGDTITFDFEGTVGQVRGPLNVPGAVTESAVLYAMNCILLDQDVPSNGGMMRPIKVMMCKGSLVDAQYPAPVAAGNVETSQRITDVVFGVLQQILPDQIPAASYGTMNNVLIGGLDHRHEQPTPYAYYETIGGGTGASAKGEGASGVQAHMTNTLNTPVEALEHAYPFMVTRYAVRKNSGGGGEHRGGDGVERFYRFVEGATLTLMTERREVAPWGVQGGGDGATGRNVLVHEGETRTLAAKVTLEVEPGDELRVYTPGGGGWGKAYQESENEP